MLALIFAALTTAYAETPVDAIDSAFERCTKERAGDALRRFECLATACRRLMPLLERRLGRAEAREWVEDVADSCRGRQSDEAARPNYAGLRCVFEAIKREI